MRRLILLPLAVAACAAPSVQPDDMSAAAHECVAMVEERQAEAQAAQYDPAAVVERERCAPMGGVSGADQTCWTMVRNPTEEHRRNAEALRRHAAEHRAASRVLRQAEAHACADISEVDRDISPFWHRADILDVAPFSTWGDEEVVSSGALVVFRPVPGLTGEWLQHLVDCHLARNAALGHEAPDVPDCPLVPKGARARVYPVAEGLAVAVFAEDPEAGTEILARAARLAPEP